jgi:hypothetical protein
MGLMIFLTYEKMKARAFKTLTFVGKQTREPLHTFNALITEIAFKCCISSAKHVVITLVKTPKVRWRNSFQFKNEVRLFVKLVRAYLQSGREN